MLTKFDISEEIINNNAILVLKPERKLSDEEYDKLKYQMEEIGAHWRERVKGFAIPLKYIKRNGYTDWQEENQYFPTPKAVAKRVVELSRINERGLGNFPFVLEPSAGQGALLDEISSFIRYNMSVQVVEPNKENASVLNSKGYIVEEETFEEYYKKHSKSKVKEITHVIMNPPFSNQRDIKHVMMAYDLLAKGGVLVAVISENSMYYNTDTTRIFNTWAKKLGAVFEPVDVGAFKESGTTIDTVIVKIVKE